MEDNKAQSSLEVILARINDSTGGLTAEHVLRWCYDQYTAEEDRKNLDVLKNILGDMLLASRKSSLHYKATISHLSTESFIQRVFDNDSIAYISDPYNPKDGDGLQELNAPLEVAKDDEELTDDQKETNRLRQEFQNKQTFFAQLMRKILADAITTHKENLSYDWIPHNDDKKNPIAQLIPALAPEYKANKLQDKISAFQHYCDKLRAPHNLVPAVNNEEKAEERYIFKAEARMYDLLIHPQDEAKQEECVKLSKKLTGHVDWRYIAVGVALLVIAATIIGVTCGAAAGAFALLGIGVGSGIGISTMIGFLTTGLTLGYKAIVGSKAKKDSPLQKIPKVGKVISKISAKIPPIKGLRQGLHHGLSFRFHAVAKAANPKKNPKKIPGIQAILDVEGKKANQG